ncbi:hypothetical protein BGZ68_000858 [Mortierella alpina]|nr:hypothetical protein BGZ68_000858 [Mortierella alpina]
MDVSVDQKYAVTLSNNMLDTLTVDLWDLTSTDHVEAGTPVASRPIATETRVDRSFHFGVCLSSNGDCVAVFQAGPTKPSFSPRFFKCVDVFAMAKEGQQLSPRSQKRFMKLKPKSTALSTFVGDAKFQHLASGNILPKDSQEHVFVTSSGHFLDVFDVTRDFQLLYTISLPSISFGHVWSHSRFSLITTLQDEIFAWRNEYGEISVWNWRTAKCVAYIPSSDFHIIATSPDGSTLVGVTSEGIARSYSVASGLLLGTADCRISNATDIVFSLDHVVVSGTDLDINFAGIRAIDLSCMAQSVFVSDLVRGSYLVCILDPLLDTAIKQAIVCNDTTVEIMDVHALGCRDAVLPCGPDCKGRWKQDIKIDHLCFDKELGRTYKLAMSTQNSVLQLRRQVALSRGEGQLLVEFPCYPTEEKQLYMFLPCRKRFLVTLGKSLELWGLPTAEQPICKLLAVVNVGSKIWIQDICHHGSVRWKDCYGGPVRYFNATRSSFQDTEDTLSLIRSIPYQVGQFKSLSVTYKKALVKIILQHINKNIEDYQSRNTVFARNERSVMWALISHIDVRAESDSFLHTVLESRSFDHWIPQPYEFSADLEQDMIAHLILGYRISTAKILINYCLARAYSDGLLFLDMLLVSVPHINSKHPEVALEIARRVAFFPVRDREAVLHHSVSNGFSWRWKLWISERSDLYQLMDQNPVFHLLNRLSMRYGQLESDKLKSLQPLGGEACERNGDVEAMFYVAPFSLVWTVQANGRRSIMDRVHWMMDETLRMVYPVNESSVLVQAVVITVRLFISLIRMVSHFIYPVYVRSKYSELSAFDNPAVLALMTYKWNRFARYFWGIQVLLQTAYELTVLGVTLFQLSLYNYVDLAAYVIPISSSGILIANPESSNALRALSFSVIIVYVHIIFELRAFKSVCKVVSVVVNILLEIPAFFVILAIFILSFAHSINHLIEVNFQASDCQPDPDDANVPSICNAQRSEFPKNYLQAVSATYFFMTGDYGAVATSLTNGHWTSQLLLGLFFFLTAMLMMNVVIALMNGVYSNAAVTANQTWLRNRVELIVIAENYSNILPYFRDQFDYFPKYVYYTATEKEVEDYQKKYGFDKNQLMFDFTPKKLDPNITNTIAASSSSTAIVAASSPTSVSVPNVDVSEQENEFSSAAAVARRMEKDDELQSLVFKMKAKLDQVQIQMELRMAEMEERISKDSEASQIQIQRMMDVLADRLVAQWQQRQ